MSPRIGSKRFLLDHQTNFTAEFKKGSVQQITATSLDIRYERYQWESMLQVKECAGTIGGRHGMDVHATALRNSEFEARKRHITYAPQYANEGKVKGKMGN